ncbi:MAG TPA: TIGR03790 family protein [Desulfotignum sp.]|nr:TIGR03790 family protein [Desulfotignum sp.]
MNRFLFFLTCIFTVFCGCFAVSGASALTPEEVLVVANRNAAKSKGLAVYYMAKRGIPEKNLVLLFVTDKEQCSRETYETKVIPPVLRALDANPGIRAIVTMYGVPLKITSPGHTNEEKTQLDRLESEKAQLEELLSEDDPGAADQEITRKRKQKLTRLKKRISSRVRQLDKTASFDSELMLVKAKAYPLNMWVPNPYYLGFANRKPGVKKSEVVMVSRLDGADDTIVRRVIDDSIEAEMHGLRGTAYFDARWQDPGDKEMGGYGLYDRSIHRASQKVADKTPMGVVLNDTKALFQKGESPDTALYCGWYSLAKYVDAFVWQKGSVGYHIASSECATLKNQNSRVWCKKMLDNGAAATIGPVGEPYVQAFPLPEIFFDFLVEGYLTLAETYLVSLPYLSWKMVLVGDPLYQVNIK